MGSPAPKLSFITLLETCATKIWRDLDQYTDKTLIVCIEIYHFVNIVGRHGAH